MIGSAGKAESIIGRSSREESKDHPTRVWPVSSPRVSAIASERQIAAKLECVYACWYIINLETWTFVLMMQIVHSAGVGVSEAAVCEDGFAGIITWLRQRDTHRKMVNVWMCLIS